MLGVSIGALAVATAAVASPVALPLEFPGPSGWTQTAVQSPTPTRKVLQWRLAGTAATSLTFLSDAATAYSEALAALKKSLSDNGVQPAVNKDVACRNATGHVVEFTTGPDGSQIVIHRMYVPDGTGTDMITYTRAVGNDFDGEVKKSESAFCGI